jgi:hypothetical protein
LVASPWLPQGAINVIGTAGQPCVVIEA